MEKEARAAHVQAMEAEVEALNAGLNEVYNEIDTLLAATLEVDDHVDLNELRVTAVHPPFDAAGLDVPVPKPLPAKGPVEPVYVPPGPPKGLFGRKKRHAAAVAEAESAHALAHAAWLKELEVFAVQQNAATEAHAKAELDRLSALQRARAQYKTECEAREIEVAEHNAKIDVLIRDLGYGTVDAVQEYISIVLSNSVYPDCFPIENDFTFDPATAELRMRVLVPPPGQIPDIKCYKYTKSTDEISNTAQSQKAIKDRYSGAIFQVALRSLHEVFEADRRGLIKTISLELGAEAVSPATGREIYVPFVAVAAERNNFLDCDLSSVVPVATLGHLGASVSKDPYNLVEADTTGVRRS